MGVVVVEVIVDDRGPTASDDTALLLYLTENVLGLITVFSPSGWRFSRQGSVCPHTFYKRCEKLGGEYYLPYREDGLVRSP